jgi:hypothetical protein
MHDLKDLLEMLEKFEKQADWFVSVAYAMINAGEWNPFGIDQAIDQLRYAIENLDEAYDRLEPKTKKPQPAIICDTPSSVPAR